MNDERRASPRKEMRAQIHVQFASWSMFSLIYTINISRGGMRLEAMEATPVGSTLTVQLQPPTGAPILLQAVVRHSAEMPRRAAPPSAAAPNATPVAPKFELGVEFQNLDAERRKAIEDTLQAHGAPTAAAGITFKPKDG